MGLYNAIPEDRGTSLVFNFKYFIDDVESQVYPITLEQSESVEVNKWNYFVLDAERIGMDPVLVKAESHLHMCVQMVSGGTQSYLRIGYGYEQVTPTSPYPEQEVLFV